MIKTAFSEEKIFIRPSKVPYSSAADNRKTMKGCLIITMTLLIFMIQVGIADNTGTIEPANENDWPIVAVTTGQRYSIVQNKRRPYVY